MSRFVVLVGGGNLGVALARGVEQDPPPVVHGLVVIERDSARIESLKTQLSSPLREEIPPLPRDSIIILTVKPRDISSVCTVLRDQLDSDHLVISCAAGVSLGFLKDCLGGHERIVRCMPNLAASCRRAVTAYVKSRGVSEDDQHAVEEILGCMGTVIPMEDEDLMHGVTALSGSGPGYLAWFAEVMERTARELGFSAEIAQLLVHHTIDGLGHLLLESGMSAQIVREQVSSPQGTTMAALTELQERGVEDALRSAILKAAARSRELAQS